MMEATKRKEILEEIAKAIRGYGGRFTANYETHLYIARRLDGP